MLKLLSTILLLSGVGSFISCTGNYINTQDLSPKFIYPSRKESVYGNYLAGRVAHIRQDYKEASKYYIKTMEKGLVNEDIIGKTYIILASQGDIENAVKYANQARSKGDKNNFIDVINAVYEFKKGNYTLSRNILATIKEKTYQNLITPLFDAWTYAGENKYEEAMSALDRFKYEVASEVGVNLKQGYNGDISSKDAGRVGGNMVRKLIQQAENNMK